jgi:hypothetical protein
LQISGTLAIISRTYKDKVWSIEFIYY